MKKVTYDVIYQYYQYNSGAADNGYYNKVVQYNNFDQAHSTYSKINASINKKKYEDECYRNNDYPEMPTFFIDEDEEDELKSDLIPYAGYFIKAQLSKTYVEKVLLDESGNELYGE